MKIFMKIFFMKFTFSENFFHFSETIFRKKFSFIFFQKNFYIVFSILTPILKIAVYVFFWKRALKFSVLRTENFKIKNSEKIFRKNFHKIFQFSFSFIFLKEFSEKIFKLKSEFQSQICEKIHKLKSELISILKNFSPLD